MDTRKLERVVKGYANHRRIQILELLAREPGLSLAGISGRLRIDVKTASEHVRRLAAADLVAKRAEGRWVRHCVSPRGDDVLTFLRMLDSQTEGR
jgi:DNA-binding MarR family transcriptional regulator